MLARAGVQNVGGAALLYTSTDLENWEYRGPLLAGDQARYPLNSMMWESPVFLPLDPSGICIGGPRPNRD